MTIKLAPYEIAEITGYAQPCKQLQVLKARGFYRAYIARKGGVVLERTHYEAITSGQDGHDSKPAKSANVTFMKKAA